MNFFQSKKIISEITVRNSNSSGKAFKCFIQITEQLINLPFKVKSMGIRILEWMLANKSKISAVYIYIISNEQELSHTITIQNPIHMLHIYHV